MTRDGAVEYVRTSIWRNSTRERARRWCGIVLVVV
jgi:hypothetical protein